MMEKIKPKKMIWVYIYKRYDTDLLSMCASGYPVAAMMRIALISYCNSIPFWFYNDECSYFDLNDRKTFKLKFLVPVNDKKVQTVIANIKHGYISNFCKTILRNSFINQTSSCYYSEKSLVALQALHSQNVLMSAFPNVHPVSRYKGLSGITINIDGTASKGKTIITNNEDIAPVFPVSMPQFSAVIDEQPLKPVSSQKTVENAPAPVFPVQEIKNNPQPPADVPVVAEQTAEPVTPAPVSQENEQAKVTLAQNDALFAAFDAL